MQTTSHETSAPAKPAARYQFGGQRPTPRRPKPATQPNKTPSATSLAQPMTQDERVRAEHDVLVDNAFRGSSYAAAATKTAVAQAEPAVAPIIPMKTMNTENKPVLTRREYLADVSQKTTALRGRSIDLQRTMEQIPELHGLIPAAGLVLDNAPSSVEADGRDEDAMTALWREIEDAKSVLENLERFSQPR